MSDELVVIAAGNIPALFKKDGSKSIIAMLKEELDSFVPDVTTAKGRKDIAAFSYKFSRSKTYLDGLRIKLVEAQKAEIKIIDAEGKLIKDTCDECRDAARKPLDDYENIEKKRVADIEERIRVITEHSDASILDYSHEVTEMLNIVKAIIVDDSFEEFELAATKAKEASLNQLEAKFIILQHAEKEAAEKEIAENERLEKEQKEREEKIAKEAAEKARKEAEDKAKTENEEKERLAKDAIEKAEKEKLEAQLATETAKREKREAAEKVVSDKIDAEVKAEADKKQAVEDEKKRREDEIRAEEEKEAKRQENKSHRKKLNNEAKECLRTVMGWSEDEAEKLLVVIIKGQISNVSINY